MSYRIGIDIGGTFTDCVVIDERNGAVVKVLKVPTTAPDQSDGFLRAIEETGISLADVSLILHGCTVGLNAIITRTGAKTGLITTKGFRDVIAMGRGQRPASDQFNPAWRRGFGDAGRPFVPRHLRHGVAERIDAAGEVVVPLDVEDVRRVCAELLDDDVQSIAICFLNSYANPAHELQAERIVRSMAPDAYVWTSTGVHPCFKEYPRFSTCVLNTYVGPLIDHYLTRVRSALAERGYRGTLMVMQSNGGVLAEDMARERPAYTLQSGPTGGVTAASLEGRALGVSRILTLDIGGTSADYGTIDRNGPVMTTELELAHDLIVGLPAVDVHSIGAGGGSIAWIDAQGALRVGPASAGSDPGPAGYGRGGTEPTVTDALIAMGIISPDGFGNGEFPLYPERARAALEPIAEHLALPTEAAAEAIFEVALANLVEAAREVSVYNGVDPRDFVLFVYGAAGPIFGARVGRELGVRAVIVPPHPGTFSAYGLAMADIRVDLGTPLVRRLGDLDPATLSHIYEEMEERARRVLDGFAPSFQRWLDGRYQGQTWETPSVPVAAGRLTATDAGRLRQDFDRTHERLWGYSLARTDVNATMARITASVPSGRPDPTGPKPSKNDRGGSHTEIFLEGGWLKTTVVQRGTLQPHERITGPVVVTEGTTTILVPPGDRAIVDQRGHLRIELGDL